MKTLFEDNHLLLLYKKGGLLTQETLDIKESLENQARAWIKERDQKQGGVFLHAIHRLDKVASGLVLFAKSKKALTRLTKAQRERKIEKTYLLLCEGILDQKSGLLKHYLSHESRWAKGSFNDFEGAKECILHYSVQKESAGLSLVEVHLQTGRYHQIRAQFSLLGHPILGDCKYGAKHFFKKELIALHHSRMSFYHPTSNELLSFFAPPPKQWPLL